MVKLPTLEDRSLLLSGDGIFFSLQGEGLNIGVPAIFIRLHMCNLECQFKGGSRCDAWYTWDKSSSEYNTESKVYTYEQVYEEINKYDCNLIVITGGEPLIQQRNILEFMSFLKTKGRDEYLFEIETNGTIAPYREFNKHCIRFNCSLKLSNSGNSLSRSIREVAIKEILSFDSIFKFVATDKEDIKEILDLVNKFGIHHNRVLIMPEGVTTETLSERMRNLSEYCKQYGWRLAPRLQFYIWGDTRRT